MMFDKELFFSLCEKYDIELSDSLDRPMIKDIDGVHVLTEEDITRAFVPYQTYFDYSVSISKANVVSKAYNIQDDLAVAC